jgi:hypothetical protein
MPENPGTLSSQKREEANRPSAQKDAYAAERAEEKKFERIARRSGKSVGATRTRRLRPPSSHLYKIQAAGTPSGKERLRLLSLM